MREANSGACTGRVALALVAAGALACASRVLQVREYILTAVSVGAVAAPSAAPVVIGIGPIDLPTYLQRPEIVSRGVGARLEVRASERWGEDLQAGIQRALTSDLERLVPSARVLREPFPARSQPAYEVAVQIQRFEPSADGDVELDVCWTLTNGPQRQTPLLRRESIREPVANATTEAKVAAMSLAVAQLASRIVAIYTESVAVRVEPVKPTVSGKKPAPPKK